MKKDNKENQIPLPALIREADLTLETVILLILGIFMLLLGLLQGKIHTGELPYSQGSTYGLLLVIASLQIITMGKTPFGSFRRSWILVILGIGTAILGTIACFIPALLADLVRELVGIILCAGGVAQILQLIFDKEKVRQWIMVPGILQHLTFACGLVYLMEIIIGVVILFPDSSNYQLNTILYSLFGTGFFYLAWCIQKIDKVYPLKKIQSSAFISSDTNTGKSKCRYFFAQDASITTQSAFFLLLGVIFILFTILLIPVFFGLFSFSKGSQFGLLMVIMAIQVLALGKTPVGKYKRSWLLILAGLSIASIGIYSCIVPGILTEKMWILLGTWNLIAGSVNLFKLAIPILNAIHSPPEKPVPINPSTKKLLLTATLLHLATIVFGINLIVSGLIPMTVIIITLFCIGVLFIILAYIMANMPASD